jgi:cell division protein FtsX
MNSPVEDRLREALTEAGATIDTSTLRPLLASERRRFRVDLRLVAVAAVVVLAGAATVVGLGGPGDEDRAVATNPEPAQSDKADMAVFLCTKSAPKDTPCQGRNVRPEQVKTIESAVRRLPEVEAVYFDDQAGAYDNLRRDFAHNKAILDGVKITDLPASFRLKIKQGADRRQVAKALGGLAGVQNVTDQAVYDAASQGGSGQEPKVSVFLCAKGSAMVSCGAERESQGKGAFKIAKAGRKATEAEKEALDALIDTMPEVESYVFEDQATAYENFKRSYQGNKALVQATKVADMPQSFRLTLKPESDWAMVIGKLTWQPGVSQVLYAPCSADRMALAAHYGLLLPENEVCSIGR